MFITSKKIKLFKIFHFPTKGCDVLIIWGQKKFFRKNGRFSPIWRSLVPLISLFWFIRSYTGITKFVFIHDIAFCLPYVEEFLNLQQVLLSSIVIAFFLRCMVSFLTNIFHYFFLNFLGDIFNKNYFFLKFSAVPYSWYFNSSFIKRSVFFLETLVEE